MSLPEDITFEELLQRCLEAEAKVLWYEEQFRLAQRRQFGPSSEHLSPEQAAFVFNEAEATADPTAPEPTIQTITVQRRSKGQRARQLKNLPVETVVHRLPDEEQVCACCGGPLHVLPHMEEIRQEYKVIPAQLTVVKHLRVKYGCRQCEREAAETPIITAPMPTPAFPGSLASPSAVAYIMSQKFVEGLPLYRQEQHFARLGVILSRQTMANWMLAGAVLLTPLYERVHEELLKRDILHADETTLQVIKEPGRAAQTKSFLWLYRSGRDGPPIILYEYQETRARKHPEAFLHGFTGFLHADAYQAYEKLDGIIVVGCWAHARRGFVDALTALPASARADAHAVGTRLAAEVGLEYCDQLFAIERDLHDATPCERFVGRLQHSRPVLIALQAWLDQQAPRVLPKSALGQAISYCRHQWEKLLVYLQDGRLEMDNNRSERSIKPIVIGRKNWLFAYSPAGATASAIIYSFVEMAKENGLDPYAYLTYLFEQLPECKTTDLDRLFPWSESLPASCHVPTTAKS